MAKVIAKKAQNLKPMKGRAAHTKPPPKRAPVLKGFPAAKKGKARMLQRVIKRPSAQDPPKVPYTRYGNSTHGREERVQWSRKLHDLLSASDVDIVKILRDDGFLKDLEGTPCPECPKLGKLGALCDYGKVDRGWAHRCSAKGCQRYLSPHHGHPIFSCGRGHGAMSLQEQAAMLFCAVAGADQSTTHRLLGKSHRVIGQVYVKLDEARMVFVEKEEKNIKFGEERAWTDVEADEATFGKRQDPDAPPDAKSMAWEQWAGVVERGRPKSLVLFKCSSSSTSKRAPGPGAIKKKDWKPWAQRHLAGRKVILHTDSARSYKMKLDSVVHDAVVHGKKRQKVGGKWEWKKPHYTKTVKHVLPDGKRLVVQGGTQVIDRAWRFIRSFMVGRHCTPGTESTRRRVRSAQWCYWHREEDRWAATGKMLSN